MSPYLYYSNSKYCPDCIQKSSNFVPSGQLRFMNSKVANPGVTYSREWSSYNFPQEE